MKDITDKIVDAWKTDKHQHIYTWQMRDFLAKELGSSAGVPDSSREECHEALDLDRDTLEQYAKKLPGFGLSYKAIAKEFGIDETTVKQLVRDKKLVAKKYGYDKFSGTGKKNVYYINICPVKSVRIAYNSGWLIPPLEITEKTVSDALYSIQCEIENLESGFTNEEQRQAKNLKLLKQRTLGKLLRYNKNIERLGLIPYGTEYKRFFGLQGYVFYFIVKDAPESEKENPLDRDLSKDPLKPDAVMEVVPAKWLLQDFTDYNIIV